MNLFRHVSEYELDDTVLFATGRLASAGALLSVSFQGHHRVSATAVVVTGGSMSLIHNS